MQAQAIVKKVQSSEPEMLEGGAVEHMQDKEKSSDLHNFFLADGTLKHLPAHRKKKLIVLEHMVKGLKAGTKYTEREINEYIRQFHPDFATFRREFIMNHYMYRDQEIYEMNPPELWGTN